jgi:glycosyltransferase involved in cell wall biosynthesis
MEGVSVIICCYNSADKIGVTLKHLQLQKNTAGISWEIILVDNASQDNTVEESQKIWKKSEVVPLRIIFEPVPGLSHAREAGIRNASYDYLSFIDDDNWVCPHWIEKIFNIMQQKPDVAMCGGLGEPVCEIEPPFWFDQYSQAYAVGPQGDQEGYVTTKRGYLYGAGSALRKCAWDNLKRKGFEYLLSGRKGKTLSSGEDYELCLALVITGYRLWYSPELKFKHYIPATRLSWLYLCRLFEAFGKSDFYTAIYFKYGFNRGDLKRIIEKYYLLSLIYSLYSLLKYLPFYLMTKRSKKEGNSTVLQFIRVLANFKEKLLHFSTFNQINKRIRTAEWYKNKDVEKC